VNFDRFTKALEDPLYVVVGAGVLGFQRAQVWRRALQRRALKLAGAAVARQVKASVTGQFRQAVGGDRPADAVARVAPLVTEVPRLAADIATRLAPAAYEVAGQAAQRLGRVAGEAAGQVGPALAGVVDQAAQRARPVADQVGDHLPPEAHELIDATADLVADIPREAKALLGEAAAFGRLALQVLRAPTSRPGYP
jgi:hypothetical protein